MGIATVMPMRATTHGNPSHSRAVVDVPSDAWDDGVMDMSTKALLVPIAKRMVGFGVAVLTAVCMLVALAKVNSLETVVPKYAVDLWTPVIIDAWGDTVIGVARGIAVDILADANANMLPVTMPVLKCIPMLTSSEDAFVFGWTACSCCPTATRSCALQARMPSCHV